MWHLIHGLCVQWLYTLWKVIAVQIIPNHNILLQWHQAVCVNKLFALIQVQIRVPIQRLGWSFNILDLSWTNGAICNFLKSPRTSRKPKHDNLFNSKASCGSFTVCHLPLLSNMQMLFVVRQFWSHQTKTPESTGLLITHISVPITSFVDCPWEWTLFHNVVMLLKTPPSCLDWFYHSSGCVRIVLRPASLYAYFR